MNKTAARAHLASTLRRVVAALEERYAIKQRDKREPGRERKEAAEERLAAILRRMFRKQRQKVLDEIARAHPERKAVVAPPVPDFDDDDMADLIDALIRATRDGVTLFGEASKLQIDWTLTNQEAARAAREYAYELVRGINDTTRQAVSQAISAFVETPGMTIRQTSELLPFDEARAQMIATTEITRAYAAGNQQAGEDLRKEFPDVRVIKVWYTNEDDITCDLCSPLNGVEVGIDEQFADGVDNPPLHPRCRCWTTTTTALAELGEEGGEIPAAEAEPTQELTPELPKSPDELLNNILDEVQKDFPQLDNVRRQIDYSQSLSGAEYDFDSQSIRLSKYFSDKPMDEIDKYFGDIDQTIRHEIGHAIQYKVTVGMEEEAFQDFKREIVGLIDKLGYPSEYSHKNDREWISERFAFESQRKLERVLYPVLQKWVRSR